MLADLPLLARYTVTGEDAAYAIPFRVYRPEDVAVTFSTNGRTETALTLGKDYSVQILTTGAELTLAAGVAGTVVPAGAVLAIASAVPATQEADLSNTATVDTEALETQLDREVQMIQQLEEELGRAVKLPAASNGSPEELLADIFDAKDAAAASAGSAAGSATAAADSAQSAAGSAAIATEEREAACICAGEAKDARDVAIAQAEAANILMEAELSKVNAIVAANKTDQQAAVTAARAWAAKAPDVPVDYDEEGNPRYSARHYARNAQENALHPDNKTLMVDDEGVLRALGGNLLLNSEAWITESGEWIAPVTGWYEILAIDGGMGGNVYVANNSAAGGNSGVFKRTTAYFLAGQSVPVVIGAGGKGYIGNAPNDTLYGGATTVEGVVFPSVYGAAYFVGGLAYRTSSIPAYVYGGGYSGKSVNSSFRWFGTGGGAAYSSNGTTQVSDGDPGAVCMRWHDPAKAAGPAPALFSLADDGMSARMRTAAQRSEPGLVPGEATPSAAQDVRPRGMVVVNLYDPETGHGSVWREEDAEAKLDEGMISEAAWQEICAEKAAEEYAAWLVDPETEPERFELLRQARDAKLAATDYLVAPDYPLSEEQRAAVIAYRQSLRDLPGEEGAPWDGGGELTPWPEAPSSEKAQEGE